MQKRILTIVITLPIVLALGIGSMLFTQSISEGYITEMCAIERLVRYGDTDRALLLLSDLMMKWEKKEPLLQLWVCHVDTDAVTQRFKEAQVGLIVKDEVLFFDQAALLLEALEHLHHRDDMTWGNVL